jgi:Domain of unknown function (DUF6378)
MDYVSVMKDAAQIYNVRGAKYGSVRQTMDSVAALASMLTGYQLTAHDVALVMHAFKLDRMTKDRTNPEHYVDGINYFAFAGEMACEPNYQENADQMIWQTDIAEMAAKLSPNKGQ